MNDNLKTALEKVLKEIIPFDKNREEEQKQFNILKAIRSSNDEVKLHSRMIASLIDPEAPHGLGKKPLEKFLQCIGAEHIGDIVEGESLTVQPNYQDKNENREMDILIKTGEYAVLIENKIWAKDSNKATDGKYPNGETKRKGQLERYYDLLVKDGKGHGVFQEENVQVVYLTVDRHPVSRESTGAIRDEGDPLKFNALHGKVKEITYGGEIVRWLNELESIENIDSSIRTLIKQYHMAVTELANVDERKNIVEAIGNLSDKERNALASLFLNEKDVCWHIADLFFQDLYKKIKSDGGSMWIGTAKPEEKVKDIYVSMPHILNETVGPKARKSIVNIYLSGNDISPALILNKGVIRLEGLVIDFNNLSNADTINISNAVKREKIVKHVYDKIKSK